MKTWLIFNKHSMLVPSGFAELILVLKIETCHPMCMTSKPALKGWIPNDYESEHCFVWRYDDLITHKMHSCSEVSHGAISLGKGNLRSCSRLVSCEEEIYCSKPILMRLISHPSYWRKIRMLTEIVVIWIRMFVLLKQYLITIYFMLRSTILVRLN